MPNKRNKKKNRLTHTRIKFLKASDKKVLKANKKKKERNFKDKEI